MYTSCSSVRPPCLNWTALLARTVNIVRPCSEREMVNSCALCWTSYPIFLGTAFRALRTCQWPKTYAAATITVMMIAPKANQRRRRAIGMSIKVSLLEGVSPLRTSEEQGLLTGAKRRDHQSARVLLGVTLIGLVHEIEGAFSGRGSLRQHGCKRNERPAHLMIVLQGHRYALINGRSHQLIIVRNLPKDFAVGGSFDILFSETRNFLVTIEHQSQPLTSHPFFEERLNAACAPQGNHVGLGHQQHCVR